MDQEVLLKDVIITIRAIMESSNIDFTIDEMLRQFKKFTGRWLPYKTLGFSSAEELFDSLSDEFRLESTQKGPVLQSTKTSAPHCTSSLKNEKSVSTKSNNNTNNNSQSFTPRASEFHQNCNFTKPIPSLMSLPIPKIPPQLLNDFRVRPTKIQTYKHKIHSTTCQQVAEADNSCFNSSQSQSSQKSPRVDSTKYVLTTLPMASPENIPPGRRIKVNKALKTVKNHQEIPLRSKSSTAGIDSLQSPKFKNDIKKIVQLSGVSKSPSEDVFSFVTPTELERMLKIVCYADTITSESLFKIYSKAFQEPLNLEKSSLKKTFSRLNIYFRAEFHDLNEMIISATEAGVEWLKSRIEASEFDRICGFRVGKTSFPAETVIKVENVHSVAFNKKELQ